MLRLVLNPPRFPVNSLLPVMRPRVTLISVILLLLGFPSVCFSQSSIKFACVGDYGQEVAVQSVANLVAGWDPDFVITVGDNNYTANNTTVTAWDNEVGRYYGQFIHYPAGSTSAYAPGPATNKFFPALGNHDWDANISGWHNYFDLPNNERYFDVVKGPVHLFFIDSDAREPNGITSSSTQGQWLQNGLANSSSPWKVVVFHHPPYSSSSTHGNTPNLQWPFAAWGASIVLTGHDHTYERIVKNGFNYIVNGIGGRPLYNFRTTPEQGSVVRYNSNYGAMLITATPLVMTLKAYSIANGLIDSVMLTSPPLPITLSSFTGTILSQTRVRLDWTTLSEVRNYGFEMQRRSDTLANFQTIPNSFVPGNGTTITPHSYSFIDSIPVAGLCSYRLKIIDLSGGDGYSEPIQVTIPSYVQSNLYPHRFVLEQNFPNPFNPSTTIRYSLGNETHVQLKIFNHLGQEVAMLVNGMQSAGQYGIQFNTKSLASGSYFYRLEAGGLSETRRLLLLK